MLRGTRAKHQRARPGESGAIVRSFANMTVQCIVKRVSAETSPFDKWGWCPDGNPASEGRQWGHVDTPHQRGSMSPPPVLEFRAETTGGDADQRAVRLETDVTVDGLLVRAFLLARGPSALEGSSALPVPVRLEHGNEDGFIVEEPVTGVFGQGQTPDAAFEDFVHALLEYRMVLLSESPRISERLAGHLRFIEALIGR